jgi:hypothetical protein
MADTAIIAAAPASTPGGSADGFVMTLKINSQHEDRDRQQLGAMKRAAVDGNNGGQHDIAGYGPE